jgi:DNA-directed RNA polymerase specialized sigma24 family protein
VDRDEALSRAGERLVRLGARFRGSTVLEVNSAIRTEVWNACMDVGRRELRHQRRAHGSIDAPDRRDPARSAYHRELAARAAQRYEADERARDARAVVLSFIEMLPSVRWQFVLRQTLQGYDSRSIASALGTTENNVDAMRSRAMRHIRERREDGDGDTD